MQGCVVSVAVSFISPPELACSRQLSSQHLGDQARDPADGRGADLPVGHMLSDLCGDRGADDLGCGGGVFHPPSGTVAGKAMGHVESLLEMMAEREVEEGPVAGHEFHRGREPALDDSQIAHSQVAIQVMHVRWISTPSRDDNSLGSIRGPATTIIRRPGMASWAQGNEAMTRRSSCLPTLEPPTVTMHTLSSAV